MHQGSGGGGGGLAATLPARTTRAGAVTWRRGEWTARSLVNGGGYERGVIGSQKLPKLTVGVQ